jgi:hypothetical protein
MSFYAVEKTANISDVLKQTLRLLKKDKLAFFSALPTLDLSNK